MSSIVILNYYRKLVRDLTVFTSMEFDEVVVVTYFLTLNFKLAPLTVVLEVDENSYDAS